MMPQSKRPSSTKKTHKVPPAARLAAGGVFCLIAAVFALLRAAQKGYIELDYVFGQCGFKCMYGLPCPGCGWTHAGQAFAAGKIIQAFVIQPAAAIFCITAVAAAIFALLIALFGIRFSLLHYLVQRKNLKWLLLSAGLIVLAGWMATLVRAVSKTGKF